MAGLIRKFEVEMTCIGCVNAVQSMLSKVPGVSRVEVDLASKLAVVHGTAELHELTHALKKTGKKFTLLS